MEFRLICKRKNDSIEFTTDGTVIDLLEQIQHHVKYFSKPYLSDEQRARRDDVLGYEHRLMQKLQPVAKAQRLQKWALMGHTDTAGLWMDYKMSVMARIDTAKKNQPQLFPVYNLQIQFRGDVYGDWVSPDNTRPYYINSTFGESDLLNLVSKIEYMQKLEAAVGQLKNWVSK